MPAAENDNAFRLTGWHVLTIFVGIFAVVIAVNAYFVWQATTTLSGLDVANAYEKGVAYKKDILAARAQAERRWNVDLAVRDGAGQGQHAVTITAADKDNRALNGLKAALLVAHPSDASKDQSVKLTETAPGVFAGSFAVEGGKWYLQLTLEQDGEPKFRSRNTVKLQ